MGSHLWFDCDLGRLMAEQSPSSVHGSGEITFEKRDAVKQQSFAVSLQGQDEGIATKPLLM